VTLVRVKICGLTRSEDVAAAVAAGADALGFVFVHGSPRYLDDATAAALVRSVPALVCRVGLFLDQGAEQVRQVLQKVSLSLLQFHGNEEAEFCRQFGRPYIKAVSLAAGVTVTDAEKAYPDAAAILVDSHAPGGHGGTGKTVPWRELSAGSLPLILAGGLNPANVAAAVNLVKPWAVDVSSGVETAPGIKDAAAIRRFIEEARRGQRS
jgi:phosphoribosylanthranilate isomerase